VVSNRLLRSCSPQGQRVTTMPEERITAAMAKADARVWVGSDRCYAFSHRPNEACKTCPVKYR